MFTQVKSQGFVSREHTTKLLAHQQPANYLRHTHRAVQQDVVWLEVAVHHRGAARVQVAHRRCHLKTSVSERAIKPKHRSTNQTAYPGDRLHLHRARTQHVRGGQCVRFNKPIPNTAQRFFLTKKATARKSSSNHITTSPYTNRPTQITTTLATT